MTGSFDNTGTYTGPPGSTDAFSGQVIASATWNLINTDYATALTQLGQAQTIKTPTTLSSAGTSYTVAATDRYIYVTANTPNIVLPACANKTCPVTISGAAAGIFGSSPSTLVANGAELINGSATQVLSTAYETVTLYPLASGGYGTDIISVGAGTVTSVGLSLPSSVFTVTGTNPVTSSGTLTGSLSTQAPGLVWASSSSGATIAPTFRALANSDVTGISTLAALTAIGANSGTLVVSSASTGFGISNPAFFIHSSVSGAANAFDIDAYGGAPVFQGRRAAGTSGSPTVVTNGTNLTVLQACGYNGASLTTSRAAINFVCNENWSTIANGTYINFLVTSNGGTVPASYVTINPDSGLSIVAGVSSTNNISLGGATSGAIIIKAPAVAGLNTLTLPAGTTDFTSTGGASQVLQQASTGAAITVGQLAASALSNGVTGSGAVALAVSPTFTGTVALPVATVTTLNGLTVTTSTGGLTITNGKTLSATNTLIFSGTDGATLAIGTGGTLATAAYKATGTSGNTVPLLDGTNTWSAAQTISYASPAPGFILNTASISQQGYLSFKSAGTEKWQVGKNADDTFFFWSTTTGNIIVASTTGVSLVGSTAIPVGGTADLGLLFSSTAHFGIYFGSSAPTLSAAQGSVYMRSDGTTTNNRMYVNTNGSTTWTAVTTAA